MAFGVANVKAELIQGLKKVVLTVHGVASFMMLLFFYFLIFSPISFLFRHFAKANMDRGHFRESNREYDLESFKRLF